MTSWPLAADWIAIGAMLTGVLALATSALALSTRRLARATVQEVQGQSRPLLIPVLADSEVKEDGHGGFTLVVKCAILVLARHFASGSRKRCALPIGRHPVDQSEVAKQVRRIAVPPGLPPHQCFVETTTEVLVVDAYRVRKWSLKVRCPVIRRVDLDGVLITCLQKLRPRAEGVFRI